MPKYCHGKGNIDTGSCCWVDGQICELRLKIENGRVYQGPNLTDMGTIAEFSASIGRTKAVRDRASAQITGPLFACRAALEVIANDGALLSDRPAFDAAWIAHADYQRLVRPAWAALEQDLGLAPNSYNCPTWVGTGTTQCCYAEDEVTNASKRVDLTTAAVTVRSLKSL